MRRTAVVKLNLDDMDFDNRSLKVLEKGGITDSYKSSREGLQAILRSGGILHCFYLQELLLMVMVVYSRKRYTRTPKTTRVLVGRSVMRMWNG